MDKLNYSWDGIRYPSKNKKYWKTFKKINSTIALDILYTKKNENMPCLYFKTTSNCEKQIVLLMILNKEKEGWHYLVVKISSALQKKITSKHNGDFYRLSCFHSFRTENRFKTHEKICKNKDI